MKSLGKYSIGMGDRFGHQGKAQLKAVMDAANKGVDVTPVWNKSNREHITIGTEPGDVRKEADSVTRQAGFNKPYFVDADHINIDTVDRFIESSDFFTIDVAAYIGKKASHGEIKSFLADTYRFAGKLKIPGIRKPLEVNVNQIELIAEKYLFAAIKAWEIFRKIEKKKGKGNFVTEVSMDEVPQPQTPVELFFILKMLGEESIPVQTIAPKFSGRFNKGVDYAGDPEKFAQEFDADLMVIDYAVKEFGLPQNLKMSIHSGSDKFAIYPYIGSIIQKHNRGIHLKTAGTTWLEEVIGLSLSGGKGLDIAKLIYRRAYERRDELCAPYATVIDIKPGLLPVPGLVDAWDSRKFAGTLRHVPGNPDYNPGFRQLIHVGYKVASEMGSVYTDALETNAEVIASCVMENIYDRHILLLFSH